MAVLTADRITKQKETGRSIDLQVAASTTIFKGSIVSVNATGFAIPAADTASTLVIGIAQENVDNSAGADGDLNVRVEKGVFGLDNDGTVVQATVGIVCTVLDDQTVSIAATTTNDITVGTVDTVEGLSAGDTVYVKIHEHAA